MALNITCPGCHKTHTITSGGRYMVCEKCGTPHCVYCGIFCKAGRCGGHLDQRRA